MRSPSRPPARRRLRLFRFERPDCTVTLEFRQWPLLAAFLAALLWYLLAPGRVSAASTAGLGGMLLFSYLWARIMALNLSGKRRLHFSALQVGDELEEFVSLRNKSALPVLWAEFIDRSDIPGYTVTSVRAADAGSSSEWRAHTTCTRRGIFTLGPWELHAGDPLGLFRVRQVYHQAEEILVYPPLAPLPQSLLPHRSSVGDHRPLHQLLAAETISVITTRPYVPGDPLRRIHWRTTARRNNPFVKTFEPEASSTVWLLADLDQTVQLGEGNQSTTEKLIVLLASLSAQLLQDHLSVGLFTCAALTPGGRAAPQMVMPQPGQPHQWEILRALAPLQPAAAQPFEDTLARAAPLVSAQDLLVAVTPSLDGKWPPRLGELIQARGARGAEALLLDPRSFGGPGSAEAFLPFLADLGVAGHVVRSEDIQPISASYGELSRWEFITTGTGHVVARKKPRAVA